jgi:hypothetical protein
MTFTIASISIGPWIPDVVLQPSEDVFDMLKDDDECIPTIANSSSSLNDYNVTLVWENASQRKAKREVEH